MKRYLYDTRGLYTQTLDFGRYDPFPFWSTLVPLPPLNGTEVPVYPSEVTVIPQAVTKRQARQQLIQDDKYDDVVAFIASITLKKDRQMAQSFWEDSELYHRNHDMIISIGGAIGLDSDALDAMFIKAAKL